MRGIAALAVVGFHFRWILNNVYAQKNLGDLLFYEGYFGVDLFFMISGFIIVYATQKFYRFNSCDFAIKRIFRVYPLFIFCLLIASLFVPHYANYPDAYFWKSLFLIPVDFNQSAPGFGYNLLLVAWTLTYEVLFYFLFLVAMSVNHKYRSAICSLLIFLIVASVQYGFNGHFSFSGEVKLNISEKTKITNMLSLIGNPMFLNFVVGMVCAEIFLSRIKIRKDLITIYLWCSLGFFLFAYSSSAFHGKGLGNIGFPCMLIFSAYLLYDRCFQVAKNKLLNFLGDVSYSLYLSHVIIIELINKYQSTLNLTWYQNSHGFSRFILLLLLCIFIAYVLHITIEKPFVKIGRYLISKIERGASTPQNLSMSKLVQGDNQ